MKVKVIKRYVDKYTHELIEIGRTLDASPERAEELINAKVVEAVPEKAARAKKQVNRDCNQ